MIYNVQDFGAVGDGVTNDTSAIQAAINAAHAAGGGSVYIPAGTYIVTGDASPTDGCLTIYDNTTVYGDGMGATTVKLADNWNKDVTGIFRDSYGVSNHDITVHDLTIDGNRAHNTGKVDGWFSGTAPGSTLSDMNITLDHVEVMNCGGYGFDPHERTTNLTITNCVSHGNGLDGFTLDFQIDAHIDNNIAYGNDRHGFNICTSSHDLELTGNIAYGNGANGITIQRGSENIPNPENITITGGEIYDNGKDGIQINKADHITISHVNIHHNHEHGVRIVGSIGSVIEDCFIHDDSQGKSGAFQEILIQSYDDTHGASGHMYLTTGTVIDGNTITDDGTARASYGVYEAADGTDYTTVSNNTISGTKNDTPYLSGSHSTFDAGGSSDNPPVAQTDDFSGTQGQVVTGNLLADNGHGADSDPDGDPLSVSAGTFATAHGSVTVQASGNFTYTPSGSFTGNDSFTYTLSDGRGGTATGHVNIAVSATPDNPPVARPDDFTGIKNQVVTGNLLDDNGHGADSDPDGDPLSVTAGTFATAHGHVTIQADGDFTYTPSTGYTGNDGFTYTLSDGKGGTDAGSVAIVISAPTNLPPVAQNDDFEGREGQPTTGNLLVDNGHGPDSDPNGDPLSVTAGTFATSHGSVTIQADGDFTYTPNAGFNGADSFNYTLSDGRGGTDTGAAHITVAGTLTAQPDDFASLKNQPLSGNLLADNGHGADSDTDGDALSVTAGTFTTKHGHVTVQADGDFTYTPTSNYVGSDSFSYTVSDGHGDTATGQANITVDAAPNHAPVAQADEFSTDVGDAVSGNVLADNGQGPDTDPDGDDLSVTAFSGATSGGGQLVLHTDGSFTYTPVSGFMGTDSFSYTLDDGHGGTAVGSAQVGVGIPPGAVEGTDLSNRMNGGNDNDCLLGMGGNDRMTGGNGDDTLLGGSGNDAIHGGNDNDTLSGGDGNDVLMGDNGNDVLTGEAGNDVLHGGNGDDTMTGGDGDDVLTGENGNDVLVGGAGKDLLNAGNGNDTLEGGSTDTLIGGKGADVYVVDDAAGMATIIGFSERDGDVIDFSHVLDGASPSNASDFVHAQLVRGGLVLSVNDGGIEGDSAGGAHFTDVLVLRGVRTFDLDSMIASGHFIV